MRRLEIVKSSISSADASPAPYPLVKASTEKAVLTGVESLDPEDLFEV